MPSTVRSSRPFEASDWTERMAERLGIELNPATGGAAQLEDHHRFIAPRHVGPDRSHLGFLRLNAFSPASET